MLRCGRVPVEYGESVSEGNLWVGKGVWHV